MSIIGSEKMTNIAFYDSTEGNDKPLKESLIKVLLCQKRWPLTGKGISENILKIKFPMFVIIF